MRFGHQSQPLHVCIYPDKEGGEKTNVISFRCLETGDRKCLIEKISSHESSSWSYPRWLHKLTELEFYGEKREAEKAKLFTPRSVVCPFRFCFIIVIILIGRHMMTCAVSCVTHYIYFLLNKLKI